MSEQFVTTGSFDDPHSRGRLRHTGPSDRLEHSQPRAAVPHDDIAAAMVAFYADLDAVIAAHGPTCRNRGDCCKFSAFGHKLYVTDLELAFFLHGQRHAWRPLTDPAACPYQIDGRCSAREHRPLGCRIFFCEDSARHWQGPEYERFQARLKALGDRFSVPYRYREWLSALKDLSSEVFPAPTNEKAIDRFPLPVIQ